MGMLKCKLLAVAAVLDESLAALARPEQA